MQRILFGILSLSLFTTLTIADEIADENKRLEGTWIITGLVVDGNQVEEKNFNKLSIVNAADGTWSFQVDGKEISRGTHVFDTTSTPKTIDFYPTDGEGRDQKFLGIYELGENTRKLCFVAAGKDRPKEFTSRQGSEQVLITFERKKPE